MDKITIKYGEIEITLPKNNIGFDFFKKYFTENKIFDLSEELLSDKNFLLCFEYLMKYNEINDNDDNIIQTIITAHKYGINNLFSDLIIKNISKWKIIFDRISNIPEECFYNIGNIINFDNVPSTNNLEYKFIEIYKYYFGNIEKIVYYICSSTKKIRKNEIDLLFSSKYYYQKKTYDFNNINDFISFIAKIKFNDKYFYGNIFYLMSISKKYEINIIFNYSRAIEQTEVKNLGVSIIE